VHLLIGTPVQKVFSGARGPLRLTLWAILSKHSRGHHFWFHGQKNELRDTIFTPLDGFSYSNLSYNYNYQTVLNYIHLKVTAYHSWKGQAADHSQRICKTKWRNLLVNGKGKN